MELHHISAEHLSVGRVREILEKHLRLALSDDARRRIVRCREYLDRKMENPERPIYGITATTWPPCRRTSSCRMPAARASGFRPRSCG